MPKPSLSKKTSVPEPLPVIDDTADEFALPPIIATGSDHRSKGEKAVSMQLAEERLVWQKKKNQKIGLELAAKQGGLVELAVIQRAVLQANATVKQQILAVIERANVSEATRADLKRDMIAALNELAYEHRTPHA